MRRSHIRPVIAAVVALALLVPVFAATTLGHIEQVTGNVSLPSGVMPSANAVLVVTLTDRSPSGGGTIIGQQRIDAPQGANIPFAVPYDADDINNKHAYSASATLVDGTAQLQTKQPVPVITGGPTEGLKLKLASPEFADPAQLTGTIALPQELEPTPQMVAYAVVVNGGTGRLVAWQAITSLPPAPSQNQILIPFTIGYDASLVDPEASYLAVAAIVDNGALWQSKTPLELAPDIDVDLTVQPTEQVIPGPATPEPEVTPTPEPTATPEPEDTPTAAPEETPTPEPEATPTAEPEETPTAAPEVTPTPEPEATPTPEPTATPTAEPTASPTPEPTPTASPTLGTPMPPPDSVTGTLVYREPVELSADARARVVVAQVLDGRAEIIGSHIIDNPGTSPIAFDVPISDLLDVNEPAYLYATIVDGENAWAPRRGVRVATLGAPVSDVEVLMQYRPDLLEGEVSGTIVGAGPDLSEQAWATAFVIDAASNLILGYAGQSVGDENPIPFSIPFAIEDLNPDSAYEVQASVQDGDVGRSWTTDDGVPVINDGAPFTDVVVTVTADQPAPTPTPAPTVAPVTPAPTPVPPADTGTNLDFVQILAILGLAVIGGIVILAVVRR